MYDTRTSLPAGFAAMCFDGPRNPRVFTFVGSVIPMTLKFPEHLVLAEDGDIPSRQLFWDMATHLVMTNQFGESTSGPYTLFCGTPLTTAKISRPTSRIEEWLWEADHSPINAMPNLRSLLLVNANTIIGNRQTTNADENTAATLQATREILTHLNSQDGGVGCVAGFLPNPTNTQFTGGIYNEEMSIGLAREFREASNVANLTIAVAAPLFVPDSFDIT